VIVLSDTSPILNLAAIGRELLLHQLYGEIVLPPAVATELKTNGMANLPSWTRVVAVRNFGDVKTLKQVLDPGEAEAIVLAAELSAGLLFVDEKRGRRIAMSRGLVVTGLLGVLAEAKARKLVDACGPILDELITRANFWISDDLRRRYLHRLNEE
jgi:predicted nucleic acid-binding protein